MNSNDPWRVMQSSPPSERMTVPAPYYGNPFLGEHTYRGTFVGAERAKAQLLDLRQTAIEAAYQNAAPDPAHVHWCIVYFTAVSGGGLAFGGVNTAPHARAVVEMWRETTKHPYTAYTAVVVFVRDGDGGLGVNDVVEWFNPRYVVDPTGALGRPIVQGDSNMRGTLATTAAPVVAPGTGGYTVKLELDPKQVLHAEICVDGKTYNGSVDLAPAIAVVMQKLAQYHADLHARGAAVPAAQVSGEAMCGEVDRLVEDTSVALVGSLLQTHTTVACAGWLDDVGNALKGAAGDALGAVQSTVSALKGPITAAATVAATSIPGIGPVVGPMAAKLVGPVIDTAANLGRPHPAVVAAQKQAAAGNQQAAQALAAAQNVAAHSITAHHVALTAQKAAAGDPVAQQQVAQVVADAHAGDPAAAAVVPVVHATTVSAPGPETYRAHAAKAIAKDYAKYQQQGGPPAAAFGYFRYIATGGKQHHKVYIFRTPDEAQGWYTSVQPGTYVYAAIFDPRNLSAPLAEEFGTAVAA